MIIYTAFYEQHTLAVGDKYILGFSVKNWTRAKAKQICFNRVNNNAITVPDFVNRERNSVIKSMQNLTCFVFVSDCE